MTGIHSRPITTIVEVATRPTQTRRRFEAFGRHFW